MFLWYGWPTKSVKLYFQPGPLPEIQTIANLRHAASRVWTYEKPEFRLSWVEFCSNDNHYTTVPRGITFQYPYVPCTLLQPLSKNWFYLFFLIFWHAKIPSFLVCHAIGTNSSFNSFLSALCFSNLICQAKRFIKIIVSGSSLSKLLSRLIILRSILRIPVLFQFNTTLLKSSLK